MKLKNMKLFSYLALIIWAIVVYFPIYWVLISSFKLPIAVVGGVTYLPFVDFDPSLKNYMKFLGDLESLRVIPHFVNSGIIATLSSGIATLLGSMAAYGLVRYKIKFGPINNDTLSNSFLSSRMVPPVSLVLSFLLMYNMLNIVDTRFGMILAYITFNLPLAVWIMKDAFADIPVELEESARIDGASPLQVFFKIVLPLAGGTFTAVFLMCFIFNWNEFLFALVLTFGKSGTVPILLAQSSTSRGVDWGRMSALSIFSIIPSVIAGLFLEKYLRKGMLAGAVKG